MKKLGCKYVILPSPSVMWRHGNNIVFEFRENGLDFLAVSNCCFYHAICEQEEKENPLSQLHKLQQIVNDGV